MIQPRILLELDEHPRDYHPGEMLSGQFSLLGMPEHSVRALEISVLWYTEGKGDEDMSVHHFQRIEQEAGETQDPRRPHRFTTELPNSPLSYGGLIVKICWCVRVRAFLTRGKELTVEMPFQLGSVPHPQMVTA